ncbi:MAG TPA: alpha/beta hydrolase [Capsulimonadaceae bacterium]
MQVTKPAKPAPLSLKRRIRRVFALLCCSYLALLVFLYVNQRALIFPGSSTQGTTEAQMAATESGAAMVSLRTASGVAVKGYWVGPQATAHPNGRTVLFFYGNGNCMNWCQDTVDRFRSMGCSVMLIDYPGYGLSGGNASDTGCYEAADAAYDYLTQLKCVVPSQIVVAGWSLGSAVAIHLASHRAVGGLVTFSAFTSMAEMASREYPIVPAPVINILLKYRFPSRDAISRVNCPVFIAHGALDRFVPPQMSSTLAAAARGPVTRMSVARPGHNDILSVGGDSMYGAIERWMKALK